MTGGGCVEWQRGSSAAGDYSLGARRKQDSTEILNCVILLPLQTCNTYLCCDEAVSLENRVWTGMQPESVPHSPIQVLPGYTNTDWAGGAACSTVTHLTTQARDCTEISITVRD